MIRILVALLLLSMSISAQHSFSLKEAQAYGLENNIKVRNAQLDVQLAKKQVMETVAIGLPHLTAEAQWQNFIDIPTTVMPASMMNPAAPADSMIEMQLGTEQNASSSLTVSQLLFDGTYIVGLRASKTFKRLSERTMHLTKRQIQDSIAVAYFNVLLIEKNKDFFTTLVDVHEHILEEIQARYEMGFVEDIDVDRMTLVLSDIQTQSDNINRMADVSHLYLKLVLGIPLSEKLELTDSLSGILSQNKRFSLEQPNIQNRLEYQLAETHVKLSKLDMQRYQSAWLPSIAAFGTYSENAMRDEFNFLEDGNWYPTKMIGVKATFNIFDGFSRRAKIQQARLKLEQSKNNQYNLEQSLFLDYETSKGLYLTAMSKETQTATNLKLAEKIYKKTLEKYKEGLVSSSELAQAGADFMKSHTEYATSIKELLLSEIKYQRTLGN